MLIELFGKNFGCFRDEFRLSMLATDIDPDSPRGVVEVQIEGDDEPLRLLRAAAIYGPNASGKSTVLFAAWALQYLLQASAKFQSDEPLLGPYRPFMLDPQLRTAPVKLGIVGVVDRNVYEYSIRFVRRQIIEETLVRSSGDEPTLLFQRKRDRVEGLWMQEPQFKLVTESFRSNALLLSLADTLAPKLASRIAVGLRQLLQFYDPTAPRWLPHSGSDPVADRAASDGAFANWLRRRLKDVDIGVVDYVVEPRKTKQYVDPAGEDTSKQKTFCLRLLHDTSEGPMPLPEGRESKGTRRFLDLAPFFFDISQGETALACFVDELDASLHPVLLGKLVRQFNCELPQSHVKGQLIFASHETALIDDEAKAAILRRDQVYFTEKNSSGAARLFSLAEFKERNNLNIRRRYLQGRYGALPSLGEFLET